MYNRLILIFLFLWLVGFFSTSKRGNFEVCIPKWLSRILFIKTTKQLMIQALIFQIWIYLLSLLVFLGFYNGYLNNNVERLYANFAFWSAIIYFVIALPDTLVYERKNRRDISKKQ